MDKLISIALQTVISVEGIAVQHYFESLNRVVL